MCNGFKNKKMTLEFTRKKCMPAFSILRQEKFERSMSRSALGPGSVTFTNYMLLEEVETPNFPYGQINVSHFQQMAYLRRLAQDYPNIVKVESVGQSHEGRDILILK